MGRVLLIGAILLLAMMAGEQAAKSAEISILDIPGFDVRVVSLKGEIVAGDGSKFNDVVANVDRAMVILQSPGGLVREALEIGAEIRLRNFSTMVPADSECYSACGLIWVSGARRYMSPTSQIGFHAAYKEVNGEYRESGVANAEIGSFLTHLGLRIEAIRFFTIAGPSEFLLLTPARARALGIEVHEENGGQVAAPDQKPTVDVYARRFVAFSFLKARCVPFLRPQLATWDDGVRNAFENGNEIVDSEQWVNLMTQQLEGMKAEIESTGALMHCIEVEAELRRQGLPTGIDGPSFECSADWSSTERALCSDQDLWAKDRAMSAVYFEIRKLTDGAARKGLLRSQRDWLRTRNNCGGDTTCLDHVYDQRLQVFRAIDTPT